MDIAIVHYNTPEITECLIKSINKNIKENVTIWLLDNSDKKPFTAFQDNIKLIDNTHNSIINFDIECKDVKDSDEIAKKGSYKHARSVDWLVQNLPNDFILLDSDVIIKGDMSFMIHKDCAFYGFVNKNLECVFHYRPFPFFLYINAPLLREHGVRYLSETDTRILGKNDNLYPNGYDSGASFYEDVVKSGLKFIDVETSGEIDKLFDNFIHLGAGSYNYQDNGWCKVPNRFTKYRHLSNFFEDVKQYCE